MENTGTIQSIDRAAAVLNCFQSQPVLGVTEISERLGLSKSTTFGIIRTLAVHQFLQQCPDGKYRLGVSLLRLGSLVDLDLRRLCQPYIESLADRIGETINLVVQQGCNVVYIEKKESPHSMRICTRIGQELPMHCTATGKAILAFLPPEQRERTISAMEFRQFTPNTIKNRQALLDSLEKIRISGYAIDDEEWESGLVCLAVPIRNGAGFPTAALSCSGPKQRMDDDKIRDTASALFGAARQITPLLP